MIDIVAPQFDINSEFVTLVEWQVPDGGAVQKDQVICTMETSKAILDLAALQGGYLVHGSQAGQQLHVGEVIGCVVAEADEVEKARKHKVKQVNLPKSPASVKATKKAIQLAENYNVELANISKKGIISEDDVKNYLQAKGKPISGADLPGVLPEGINRVLVITAGVGAMQVVDILLNDPGVQVVGCVDDDPALRETNIFGAPVVGELKDVRRLWRAKKFDSAIVAASSRIALRKQLYEDCVSLGIPMANAIDPTVRINRGCVMGQGNIICSQVHIGVATRLGDNNFISAKTNIDHHNRWGSHITTGPNCVLSSLVTVADEVKFGTGIFVQPGIEIGRGAVVASGAVLIQPVLEKHAVKVKIQSKMTPL